MDHLLVYRAIFRLQATQKKPRFGKYSYVESWLPPMEKESVPYPPLREALRHAIRIGGSFLCRVRRRVVCCLGRSASMDARSAFVRGCRTSHISLSVMLISRHSWNASLHLSILFKQSFSAVVPGYTGSREILLGTVKRICDTDVKFVAVFSLDRRLASAAALRLQPDASTLSGKRPGRAVPRFCQASSSSVMRATAS